MAINIGYLTANKTSAGDEVYTPFYAVEPLMEFLPKDKKIWCPFDEEWSAFYQYLTEQGFYVERSSLKDDKDFFHFEPDEWDILVSNPPFSKKNEVLKRAFAFQKPFALLLPVNSIQGKARYKIFNNEIQMLCFDSRVDYHTQQNMLFTTKGNHFGSAYFCRNLLPTKLELRQLHVFYVLINYTAGNGEDNVYFLNKVDDYDLYALLYAGDEDDDEKDKITPEQAAQEAEKANGRVQSGDSNDVDYAEDTAEDGEESSESAAQAKSVPMNKNSMILVFGVVALIGVGVAGFFLMKKKKGGNKTAVQFEPEYDDDTEITEESEDDMRFYDNQDDEE